MGDFNPDFFEHKAKESYCGVEYASDRKFGGEDEKENKESKENKDCWDAFFV